MLVEEIYADLEGHAKGKDASGKDALGEVSMKVDFGNGELVPGKGASTDIIEASARAYLNAVNRYLNLGKGKAKRGRPRQP